MASALVDVVVEKLVGHMIERIGEEASLVVHFREEFEWLSRELGKINGYLSKADLQSARNTFVKDWLLEVAEIAWDAEDIMDECVQSQGTDNGNPQSSCICAFSSELAFRCKMAHRIKDVKDRMTSILDGAAKINDLPDLTPPARLSSSTSKNEKWRGTSQLESNSRAVGIKSKVEDVLRLLDDPDAPLIAVFGTGGVGKTFLMQHVFDIRKSTFDKSIWLAISPTYSLRKLQADMASEINLKDVINGQLTEVQAAKLIKDRLESTRCLIVLDDVWRATGEYNLLTGLGIPTGKKSLCKTLITTRSRDVCSNMNAREYEVQHLSEEESWNLFCAIAFPESGPQNQAPDYLKDVAQQIERRCGRLPLAVKTVAASLAGKTLLTEWESQADSTGVEIMKTLKLSYDSLPAHLKPCFAFLSFFPENEKIDPIYLINLWIAEGYIPQRENQGENQGANQLDIGWSYINHLHSLCLVDIVSNTKDEQYKMFKLHDLLLALAVSISKENRCAFSVEEAFKKGPTAGSNSRYHRILLGKKSICNDHLMARERAYSASCLRSLSFSQNREIENIPAIMLTGARALRILDLSHTSISSLPDCVRNAKLLRVLNLSGTGITELPESVKSKKYLRFLDISNCRDLKCLPKWIGELNRLEYLNICGFKEFLPKEISQLSSLQVLRLNDYKLSIEEDVFLKLEHFEVLTKLREVRIDIRHESELNGIADRILARLVKMRILRICNRIIDADIRNRPTLSEVMLAMKHLEFLMLDSFPVPNWIDKFANLMQLELLRCHCDVYPALENMPNLIKLELDENSICKALPKEFGKPSGFQKLRHFRILRFSALEEMPELEEGAMPQLEVLYVFGCRNLKKIPPGLELLRSLKECSFKRLTGMTISEEHEELRKKMETNKRNVTIMLGN